MIDTTIVVLRPTTTTVVVGTEDTAVLGAITRVILTGSIGPPGPQGPAGPGGGGASYEHDQVSASATWVIPHNFGFKPNIQVMDSIGEEMIGYLRTDAVDMNTTTLSWLLLISGRAIAS